MGDFSRQVEHKKTILKRGGWSMLPYGIFERYPVALGCAEQLVISHMYDFIKDRDGWNDCHPLQRTIAKRIRKDRTFVNKLFTRLCRLGIIEKVRTQLACRYEFTATWLAFVDQLTQPDVTPVTSDVNPVTSPHILHAEVMREESESDDIGEQISFSFLDKKEEGEKASTRKRARGRTKKGDGIRNPHRQLPLVTLLPGNPDSASPDHEKLDHVMSDASANIMEVVMGGAYSKTQQVGPRKVKAKTRLGQTSKKRQTQAQIVFERFCQAARAHGYDTPVSLGFSRQIDERISEQGLDRVCEGVEFGVNNWGRMKDFFPRGSFHSVPNLRELCLSWVLDALILKAGDAPVTSQQSGAPRVQTDEERRAADRKKKDEIVKQRILRQCEENKKKHSAG